MSGDSANTGAMSSRNETPATNPNPAPKPTSLVDLKNGKVVFKQKPVSFEKQSETLQEIVKFREMLEGRIERQEPPLTSIPDDHRPLIAKLAHESDKTLAALSKHIRQELLPTQDEDNNSDIAFKVALPLDAVEAAIKLTVDRRNYGLEAPGNIKIPANACVWRWEVKEEHWGWLPKNGREKAESRQAERAQAKNDLKVLFELFTQSERDAILDPKGSKAPARNADGVGDISSAPIDLTSRGSTKSPTKRKALVRENVDDSTPAKAARAKAAADPEKIAKAEKEKREQDARDKSRSLMANFFAKPKATQAKPKDIESVAGPSTSSSEFERVFKPFVLKKDTELAPVNWFLASKKQRGKRTTLDTGVIVIDDDADDYRNPPEGASDVCVRLQSIIARLPRPTSFPIPLHHTRQTSIPHLKTSNPDPVRDIVARLSEAEIAGDVSLVRELLTKLRDRETLPIKVLIFRDDARPGYFGTWTRNSYIVGPRNPFAKDALVLDYSYDSDDAEDEDNDEEADSDLDDWLVDDDEEPEVVGDVPGSLLPPPDLPRFRNGNRLTPGEAPPNDERSLHLSSHSLEDLFNPYRIQLFNDTPFPIDPFTFTSTCLEDKRASAKVTSSGDGVFAVPSLPNRLNLAAPNPTGPPDTHMPFLLKKITTLEASSITLLVEAIFQDLRPYKVKKNAIEAKIREVGERCKAKKVWVIKPTFVI
ncbi:hypothetical protein BD779DRAFT_1670257 [Infundibulicybe gibba]|nr:hypothetical protein BD779DRAFT_1670257 [Infundibulicybe gibba]